MPADLCMVKSSLQAAKPAAAQVATPMPGPSGTRLLLHICIRHFFLAEKPKP